MLISPSLIFLESWVCNLVEDKNVASPIGIRVTAARKVHTWKRLCIVLSLIFTKTFRLPSDVRKFEGAGAA